MVYLVWRSGIISDEGDIHRNRASPSAYRHSRRWTRIGSELGRVIFGMSTREQGQDHQRFTRRRSQSCCALSDCRHQHPRTWYSRQRRRPSRRGSWRQASRNAIGAALRNCIEEEERMDDAISNRTVQPRSNSVTQDHPRAQLVRATTRNNRNQLREVVHESNFVSI